MERSVEERLAAMEIAVANMQRSIDDIKKEKNDTDEQQDDNLASRITSLGERLDSITIALQQKNYQQCHTGQYKPWSEENEVLLTHKYVAKEVLLNVMWKAIQLVDLRYTGYKELDKLLDNMPLYTISRTRRFPEHGLYINIDHLDVYHKIQMLKEFAYKESVVDIRVDYTSQFKTVVSTLQTLALSNVGSGRIVGMIHDRKTFEEEYKLTWVTADQTIHEQTNDERENVDTGGD